MHTGTSNKPAAILLGLHNHQPIDNFDWVIDMATVKAYRPFLEALEKHPGFKVSIHFSGWLLEQIETKFPDLFDTLRALCDRGDLEFLTGGFYEPVLAAIPSEDRVAQIKKLSKYIKKKFGQEPKGLWLTERVWDGSVIGDLVEAGVEYVVVDDYHFLATGFAKEKLHGYYLTEGGGETLKIFPIDQTLRYLVPFRPVEEIVGYMEGIREERRTAAGVIFDDGEKFGVWPKTHRWVYETGWLERFFETVKNSETVRTLTYSQYMEEEPPSGLVYLPDVSYKEMGEWSLDAGNALKLEHLENKLRYEGMGEAADRFIRGGAWKNFFLKYPESNRLHKKVLWLAVNGKSGKKYKEALHKAQCNDALWHGVFGGLYLPNLRDTAYRYAIECENRLHPEGHTGVEILDQNMDGFREIHIKNDKIVAVIDSGSGGQMTEFSVRTGRFNYQNTLTRRFEAYHETLRNAPPPPAEPESPEGEEGIGTIHGAQIYVSDEEKARMVYDWHMKNSFVDHVVDGAFNGDAFRDNNYREYSDMANQPFNLGRSLDAAWVSRTGGVYGDGESWDLSLSKKFDPLPDGLAFTIHLLTNHPGGLFYLLEVNLHFAEYEETFINGHLCTEPLELRCKEVLLEDRLLGNTLKLSLDREFDLATFPLYTVSQSEQGVDLTLQGISLGLRFPLERNLEIHGSLEVKA